MVCFPPCFSPAVRLVLVVVALFLVSSIGVVEAQSNVTISPSTITWGTATQITFTNLTLGTQYIVCFAQSGGCMVQCYGNTALDTRTGGNVQWIPPILLEGTLVLCYSTSWGESFTQIVGPTLTVLKNELSIQTVTSTGNALAIAPDVWVDNNFTYFTYNDVTNAKVMDVYQFVNSIYSYVGTVTTGPFQVASVAISSTNVYTATPSGVGIYTRLASGMLTYVSTMSTYGAITAIDLFESNKQLFITNGTTLTQLNISNPTSPAFMISMDLTGYTLVNARAAIRHSPLTGFVFVLTTTAVRCYSIQFWNKQLALAGTYSTTYLNGYYISDMAFLPSGNAITASNNGSIAMYTITAAGVPQPMGPSFLMDLGTGAGEMHTVAASSGLGSALWQRGYFFTQSRAFVVSINEPNMIQGGAGLALMQTIDTSTFSTPVNTPTAAMITPDQTRIITANFASPNYVFTEYTVNDLAYAAVSVTGQFSPAFVAASAGGITLTVTVTNGVSGSFPSYVWLTNLIPSGLTPQTAVPTVTGGFNNCSYTGNFLYCSFGLMLGGDNRTLTFSLSALSTTGTYFNWAAVSTSVNYPSASSRYASTPITISPTSSPIVISANTFSDAVVSCFYSSLNFDYTFAMLKAIGGVNGMPDSPQNYWVKAPLQKFLHGTNVSSITFNILYGPVGYGNNYTLYDGPSNWVAPTITCNNAPPITGVNRGTRKHLGIGVWDSIDVSAAVFTQYTSTNTDLNLIFAAQSSTPLTYVVGVDSPVLADRPYLQIAYTTGATCGCAAGSSCVAIQGQGSKCVLN